MNEVLILENVCKSYGKIPIVKEINLKINKGEIFGFLGANGAGKTTTIRMITGLVKPDRGSIYIDGYDIKKQFTKAMKSVGCIVENPDMYGEFTGRENLKIFATLYGNVDKKRIDEVIDIIGLGSRIDDRVSKYSLGMKQRLGLGQALLPKPKLLILDEPTNGLDPIGIIDFRKIVRDLVAECGTAVLISSHILAEIEQMCNKVAFIDNGRIVSVEDTANLKYKNIESVGLRVRDIEKAIIELKQAIFIKTINRQDDTLLLTYDKDCFPILINFLTSRGIEVLDIYKVQQNLEERFMEIAGSVK
ncbi:MAG: ABC transporter ATP-binding protein [Clostridium sp.]|uniref:ABC transporter ATP-binding protein n=1 Tax=Clostridium sp. TaxID=1506 RepID=UPI00306E501D